MLDPLLKFFETLVANVLDKWIFVLEVSYAKAPTILFEKHLTYSVRSPMISAIKNVRAN
jgi:hypothetical protein